MPTFTIKGTLPGLNEILSASNSGPGVGNRLKQQESVRVAWYARQAKLAPVSGPVRIHFEWIEPNRRRDPDNIRTGAKIILDVLQPLSDAFEFDAQNPRVVVTIEEA